MFLVFFISQLFIFIRTLVFGLIDSFSFLGPLLYQLVEVDKISIYERRMCFPLSMKVCFHKVKILYFITVRYNGRLQMCNCAWTV